MASDAGRGYRGGHRENPGAGRAGNGAGRISGRGNGRGGERNRYSWKRDDIGDCTNSTSSNMAPTSGDTSRWEAAATAPNRRENQDGGIWVEKNQKSSGSGGSGGGNQVSPPARRPLGKQNIAQVPPSKNLDSCIICKSHEHLPTRCPQAFCERCSKLGHLASVCTVFLPWECIAPMCAFQSKGQGFYYIHDSCTANQIKERSNSIVVTIVEGETSTRQMEIDLTNYLATGWRCSAHAIGPGTFVVRFPNPRAAAQICYVGRVTLKTSGAVIHASPWSSAIGSKGVMEIAWVKVSNVPLDKRSERNLAYVTSLVGVPLEIDAATLHRPASVRVKMGCRNVDEIPGVAESVLGGHFYDFYYEVDQVLVRDPDRESKTTRVSSQPDGGSFKKRTKYATPGANLDSSATGLGENSLPIPQREERDPIRESQESMESDESLHTTLLIETMTCDQMACDRNVVEVVGQRDSTLKVSNEYRVESPKMNVEVIPTPPLVTEENLRFSLRNVQSKLERVDDKAKAVAMKRDVEGLMSGTDREAMERGAKMLRTNASAMMRICAAPTDSAMD